MNGGVLTALMSRCGAKKEIIVCKSVHIWADILTGPIIYGPDST